MGNQRPKRLPNGNTPRPHVRSRQLAIEVPRSDAVIQGTSPVLLITCRTGNAKLRNEIRQVAYRLGITLQPVYSAHTQAECPQCQANLLVGTSRIASVCEHGYETTYEVHGMLDALDELLTKPWVVLGANTGYATSATVATVMKGLGIKMPTRASKPRGNGPAGASPETVVAIRRFLAQPVDTVIS